jgi:hypothetical protein
MLWVGEYSASQDAFHVQPLEEALKANLRRILVKDPVLDWCVFAWGDEMFVRRMLMVIKKGQARQGAWGAQRGG